MTKCISISKALDMSSMYVSKLKGAINSFNKPEKLSTLKCKKQSFFKSEVAPKSSSIDGNCSRKTCEILSLKAHMCKYI